MNPAHPICQPLQELVPASSDHWDKLLEVIEWAGKQYDPPPAPADGSLRGLDHCKRDTENALALLEAFPPQPELTPDERLILAISLVVHDVGRAGGSDGHGAQSAERLHEAGSDLGLNVVILDRVEEVVSAHDLQGERLAGALVHLCGRRAIEGRPRTGYMALLVKLADLLDTDANRVAPDNPSAVISSSKRVVRLARSTISEAGPNAEDRTLIFRARPRTRAACAAVTAYLRRLNEQEFSAAKVVARFAASIRSGAPRAKAEDIVDSLMPLLHWDCGMEPIEWALREIEALTGARLPALGDTTPSAIGEAVEALWVLGLYRFTLQPEDRKSIPFTGLVQAGSEVELPQLREEALGRLGRLMADLGRPPAGAPVSARERLWLNAAAMLTRHTWLEGGCPDVFRELASHASSGGTWPLPCAANDDVRFHGDDESGALHLPGLRRGVLRRVLLQLAQATGARIAGLPGGHAARARVSRRLPVPAEPTRA